MQNKKSLFLTTYLSIFLFWLGLGINKNISDMFFWVHTSKSTIWFEWFFIFLYLTLFKRFPSLPSLWEKHRFIVIISTLWCISISLSYLLSPFYSWKNELALIRYIETLSHFLFFIFLWDFFNRHKVNYSILFTSLILSSFIILIYLIYLHYAYPDLQMTTYSMHLPSDQYVLNTQFRRIGYLLEVSIIFTFSFLFLKKYQFAAMFIIGLLFFSLLTIGGRAALLGAVVVLMIYFFYFKKYLSLKMLLTPVMLTGLLLTIVLYFKAIDVTHSPSDIDRTIQATSLNSISTGRIEVWSLVLQHLQNQWILGTGPQSYFFYPDRRADVIHAHNFILQFLGEWGIMGSLLFFALLYRAVKHGMTLHLHDHIPNKERYHLAAGVAMVALSVTGLFGGIYFFPQTSVYLIFCFALWITPAKT